MWFFTIFLALVCDKFAISGYIYDKGLGTECLYDEDCITRNSFCKGNKICACKIGYLYDPGSDICFPKEVELKCNEDYDCSAIQNARCSYGKCQCKPNYVTANDRGRCLPSMRLTSLCEEDSQCNSVMNRSFCDPHMKRCICEPGYQQNTYRMQCVEKTKLHRHCMKLQDCEEEEELRGKVECRPNGNGLIYTCECIEGYIEKNDTCYKDGASQAFLSSAAITSVLLAKWMIAQF